MLVVCGAVWIGCIAGGNLPGLLGAGVFFACLAAGVVAYALMTRKRS